MVWSLGPHIAVHAGRPGADFQFAARALARNLVGLFGGVAWDDSGTVCYAAPSNAAAEAWLLLSRKIAKGTAAMEEIEIKMIEQGLAIHLVMPNELPSEILMGAEGDCCLQVQQLEANDIWLTVDCFEEEGPGFSGTTFQIFARRKDQSAQEPLQVHRTASRWWVLDR
jgi:hypothetical protein